MSSLKEKLRQKMEEEKKKEEVKVEKPKQPTKPKVEKKKEKCPYCFEEFASVSRHLPNCSVLKEKLDKLSELESQSTILNQRITTLNNENTNLEKENKESESKLEELTLSNAILESKLEDLSEKEDWVQFDNLSLEKDKIEMLISIIDKLDVENIELKGLYEKKIKDWKTREKLFELDLDKIMSLINEAVITGFEMEFGLNEKGRPKYKYHYRGKEILDQHTQVCIRRIQGWEYDKSGTLQKKAIRNSYLRGYINIINGNPNETIKEDFVPQNIDSVTLEVLREYLLRKLEIF